MRGLALVAALMVATGALAGCVSGEKDEPITPASMSGERDVADAPSSGEASATVDLFSPLPLSIRVAAPEWVAPGTSIPVDVPVPEKARGNVTYVWSIGPLPGQMEVKASHDTGYIRPGETASLKFDETGTFALHCHPHPWMNANVTVVDGHAGPDTVHVQVIDGARLNEYRYVPERVLVGPGTTVVYHNNGTQPHTATLTEAGPRLKKLPLEAASGEVSVEGDGWQRVVVFAMDGDGRVGQAEAPIYVKDVPIFHARQWHIEFPVGGAPEAAQPPSTSSFVTEHPGMLRMNYTVRDLRTAGELPVNNAQVEIHVTARGETEDTLTSDSAKTSDVLEASVQATTYDVKIVPKRGVDIEGILTIEVIYAPIPPGPGMGSSGDEGGHGDHAH